MHVGCFRDGFPRLSYTRRPGYWLGALQVVSSHGRVSAACWSLNLGQSLFHQKHVEGGERSGWFSRVKPVLQKSTKQTSATTTDQRSVNNELVSTLGTAARWSRLPVFHPSLPHSVTEGPGRKVLRYKRGRGAVLGMSCCCKNAAVNFYKWFFRQEAKWAFWAVGKSILAHASTVWEHCFPLNW